VDIISQKIKNEIALKLVTTKSKDEINDVYKNVKSLL
jgi:hypothetical protein